MSNPCMSCSIDMDCCKKFSGALVSQEEYDRLYARFDGRFRIERVGRFLKLYDVSGEGCPYFEQGTGCTVYDQRPLDCRLFPFSLDHMREDSGGCLKASVNTRVGCPHAHEFPVDKPAIAALSADMARAVGYADARVEHERGFGWLKYLGFRAVRKARRLLGLEKPDLVSPGR